MSQRGLPVASRQWVREGCFALIRISSPASSYVRAISPSRHSNGTSTSTGSIGASRLPAGALSTAQHTTSASISRGP